MACPRLPELLVTLGHGGSDLPKLAAKELQALGAEDVERSGQARIFVRLPQTFEVDVDKLAALQAPEKVYAIVMRVPTDELMPQLPADGSGPDCEDALAKIIAESHGWAAALDLWRTVTRRPPEALKPSFRVTGSRAGKKAAHLRSNGIAEATGEAVMLVHKWQVAVLAATFHVISAHCELSRSCVAEESDTIAERRKAIPARHGAPGCQDPASVV
eukprot:TRINITY_DN8509_c0_g1_i10.p1 TRINITY_DN8509_c0_g1~~TRINITY_DN8509_c0_g1_i10.p1  ORF type:complete len:216 (-),score=24.88 TRINITY_DN8509_c0_g1_i10:17-664(-)